MTLPIETNVRRRLTVLVAVACLVPAGASAGEAELTLTGQTQTMVVDNPGPAVVPTIYLVGRPDRSARPVRKTKGVCISGTRLTETLLSESVLILRPDGASSWGYHTGFDIFRGPQFLDGRPIDPRTLVEYDKWRYDPSQRPNCVGGDMNLLRLHFTRPMPPAVYEIAFPDPIGIRSLEVRSNCDQIRLPGVIVRVRAFSDRGRKKLIAERTVGPDQPAKRFPVRLEGLDHDRVYLELSAEAPQGTSVCLYYTFFEAILDSSKLQLPKLATGKNVFQVTDDPDSSHRGRVVLRWQQRPAADRVWDDFERSSRFSGCKQVTGNFASGLAFTGERFGRATFPANGRCFGVYRSLDGVDLSGFNHLGIALRARQVAPMRAVLFGIKNGQRGYQYVRLRPGPRWTFQTFDISRLKRDRVTGMTVYWSAVPGFDRPDVPCVYDIDTISFWQARGEPPPERTLPKKVAEYRSPAAGRTPPKRTIPPVQHWFPMGVYDGTTSRPDQECRWLFDRMKRLNMNTVYLSNGNLEGLNRILPLAEASGIRLVYQGTSDGALYYLHLATPEARLRSMEKVILPRAREWVPRFRGRWGLVAWSLTEEIGPELSAELTPFYQLVRDLDPKHPPTVLHNNLKAAEVDLKTNHPLVVTHDFYPFFWSPRSGPSNPGRSVSAYRSHVASYYKLCRRHGASLWMMPQAWGQDETRPLDPPNYGYRCGMRTPQPGEIKLQGWVAIAEGATGLMFYATLGNNKGTHHLWDAGWTETANTRAAGELFARVRRVAPLLCRLERDYKEATIVESSDGRVLAHSFVKRPGNPGKARYVVLASLDGFEPRTFDLTVNGEGNVYDMVARRDVTGKLAGLELAAGEGTLLLVGTPEDYAADCRLIDEESTD